MTRTIARTAHGAVLIGHDPEAGVAVLKVRHGAEAIADTVREAAALQRRCVALCEEVVGAREPRTLEALRKLAVILERTAQPAEAQDVRVTLAAREGRSSK